MSDEGTSPQSLPDEKGREFTELLPAVQRALRFEFRYLRGDAAEEALQEGVANSFVAFHRLQHQGRADQASASSLARFAAQHIRAGRSVATTLNSGEALSRYAQKENGFSVSQLSSLPDGASIEEAVADRRASVPDRVALRIDVPAWLQTLSRTMRSIARDLAMGYGTGEVAEAYGLTSGRISQIRRELYGSWQGFHGVAPANFASH